jgi:hypothetical protein
MRRAGVPIKRIAAELGVSPSSASYWTRDIKLTDEQRERNLRGPGGPQNPAHVRARAEAVRTGARARRASFQRAGRERARAGDPHHQAGCMLYWAEGTKNRNSVRFCNSDPNMVRFFRHFLTDVLDVEPERLALSLHVYLGNGLTIAEIERHWLDQVGLTRSALRKHLINPLPTSSSGSRPNKLPYGVATLALHSTAIVQHIFGAIQEYAGFDEPRWLDGPSRR